MFFFSMGTSSSWFLCAPKLVCAVVATCIPAASVVFVWPKKQDDLNSEEGRRESRAERDGVDTHTETAINHNARPLLHGCGKLISPLDVKTHLTLRLAGWLGHYIFRAGNQVFYDAALHIYYPEQRKKTIFNPVL